MSTEKASAPERVSDEQLQARVESIEDWIADGLETEALPLRDVLSIFRELQERRAAPGDAPPSNEVVEAVAKALDHNGVLDLPDNYVGPHVNFPASEKATLRSDARAAIEAYQKATPPHGSPREEAPAPDPNVMRDYIIKLTTYWMENPGWTELANEARGYVGALKAPKPTP